MMYLRVFLKFCEGCGALGVRSESASDRYCGRCKTKLESFPAPLSRRVRGRKRSSIGHGNAVAVAGGAR